MASDIGKTLDCETYERALESLASAFGVQTKELLEIINSIDLEETFSDQPDLGRPNHALANQVVAATGKSVTLPEQICWFHLTRTTQDCDFRDGILPLGAALEKIWTMLGDITEGTEHAINFARIRKEPRGNFQYNLKVSNTNYAGPYAMLIRDAAFRHKEIGNHDYLSLPEIISDICEMYQEQFDLDISHIFKERLYPCIVKFRSKPKNEQHSISLIASSTYYLYRIAKNEAMNVYSGDNFDGQNTAVPPSDILSMTFQ
jgi:hypothetical protein